MIKPTPITGYVGVNGSGKTLSAVAFALTDLKKRGRPLVANVAGLEVDHYRYTEVEELPDLMARVVAEHRSDRTGKPLGMNIIMDEAGALFASRDSGRNRAFQQTCQQLRKYRARLLWTAPAFARADKILREVTFTAIQCRSAWSVEVRDDPWPSTRLILQKSYDVSRLDNSGMTINRNARAKTIRLIRTKRWQYAFDSFALAGALAVDPNAPAVAEQVEAVAVA